MLGKVSQQVALPFAERTLVKCREFEDTGRSCFGEGILQNIIFSTPTSNTFPNSIGKQTSNSMQPKSSGKLFIHFPFITENCFPHFQFAWMYLERDRLIFHASVCGIQMSCFLFCL